MGRPTSQPPVRGRIRLPRAAFVMLAVGALVLSMGCSGTDDTSTVTDSKGVPMSMDITSPAFAPDSPIPTRFTGDGEDVSPPLEWAGLPDGTVELSLIVDDPDAPGAEPWVHWVLYRIPVASSGLAEGLSGDAAALEAAGGPGEGANDFGRVGYGGPAPPRGHGVHHYQFKLYALDMALDLGDGATKKELLEAMSGHVLAQGLLVGTYER